MRALILLLLTLPLAACGGASDAVSVDPVAQAADKTVDVAGAHFQLSARIGAQGNAIAFNGDGEIADHGRKLHMTTTMPASMLGGGASGDARFEIVGAGRYFYLHGAEFDQFAHGKWVRVQSDNSKFELGQSDPSQMLRYLRATSNVDEVGKDSVRGVETTHYTARLQVDKVASRVSLEAARALRQMTKTLGTKEIPMDVWVDGDGLVRRLKVDWHPKDATFVMTLDLFDFGNVQVDVPPSSDTVDLSTMLGGG